MQKIPIEKGRLGIPLTEIHKKKISEALKKYYGTTDYNEAFTQFVKDNMNVISGVAEKFTRFRPKEELIASTIEHLYYKFNQYNPALSQPGTFISVVAKRNMFWECQPDTLNKGEYLTLAKINILVSNHYSKTGQMLGPEQVAEKLKLKPDKVKKILENSQQHVDLDKKTFENSDILMGDMLTSDKLNEFSNPENVVIASQTKILLDNALNTLTEREKDIILDATGYESGEKLSDIQIGKKIGLTSMRIGAIRKEALKKMESYVRKLSPELAQEFEKAMYANKEDILKIVLEYLNEVSKQLDLQNNVEQVSMMTKSLLNGLKNYNLENKISKSTEDIRIRQRDPRIFSRETLRTITISKSLGIKAVIGNLPSDNKLRVQTLIFNRNPQIGKSWNLHEAKDWVRSNKDRVKISIDVKELLQKIGGN